MQGALEAAIRKMGLRIGIWVPAGAIVTCFWVPFGMAVGPSHNFGHWTVVAITLLASLLWQTRPINWYTVMFLNGAIYGLVGFAVEPLIRLRRPLTAKPRQLR